MKKVVPLQNLINQFERLPGIGHKSAQRLAFHVLKMPQEDVQAFADSLLDAHSKIHRCEKCCDLTDGQFCPICDDPGRDAGTICVVEDSRDVMAFERTHEYNGVYHVLHGVISPLNGVGPEDITVKELLARLSDPNIKEVIMATNPTAEGEATAIFIARLIKPMGIDVTRLAYGVPVGADLEYADEFTLLKAIEGRKKI
ncbi:MAG: recombination protein RecR [Clostridia bacterium]|nr:recombination protein RecR [Clostridia bacterium]